MGPTLWWATSPTCLNEGDPTYTSNHGASSLLDKLYRRGRCRAPGWRGTTTKPIGLVGEQSLQFTAYWITEAGWPGEIHA
jgi:hypothetical protein